MYKLKTCVWEITLACCFSCDYCGSRGGQARRNELSTDECLKVADQLAELGCRRVVLIGGEALMRPDWDIIARKLVSKKSGHLLLPIPGMNLLMMDHVNSPIRITTGNRNCLGTL